MTSFATEFETLRISARPCSIGGRQGGFCYAARPRGRSIGSSFRLTRLFCSPFEFAFHARAPDRCSVQRAVSNATRLPRPDGPVREPGASGAHPETGWRGEDCKLKKLYVGNLSFSTTEDELRTVFENHGSVASVNVITDRETGRARGFAFVEMEDASAADAAMQALDGSDLGGRNIKVNEAQAKRQGGGGDYRSGGRY